MALPSREPYVRQHGLDSGISRSEAPQVPRRQTADEADPIARPRDQSGDGVGVLGFGSRQRTVAHTRTKLTDSPIVRTQKPAALIR